MLKGIPNYQHGEIDFKAYYSTSILTEPPRVDCSPVLDKRCGSVWRLKNTHKNGEVKAAAFDGERKKEAGDLNLSMEDSEDTRIGMVITGTRGDKDNKTIT